MNGTAGFLEVSILLGLAWYGSLFDKGFVGELIRENLFPDTWITDYSSEDYDLIVEHRRISPLVLPEDWTFTMLQDAALMVLKVARIAWSYGCNMKDCHGMNVIFENSQPKFVDLGSFHINPEGVCGWQPYEEFLRFYYYPLFMWKDGLEYASKSIIFNPYPMPHSEHLIYKYKALKCLSPASLPVLVRLLFLRSRLALCDHKRLEAKLTGQPNAVRFVAKAAKRWAKNPSIDSLEKMTKSLKRKRTATAWRDYHAKLNGAKKQRFDSIFGLVNRYLLRCPDCNRVGWKSGAIFRQASF